MCSHFIAFWFLVSSSSDGQHKIVQILNQFQFYWANSKYPEEDTYIGLKNLFSTVKKKIFEI